MPDREKQKTVDAAPTDENTKDDEVAELPQPEDDRADERGVAKSHPDNRLRTRLTSEGLQKRLLSLFYDAKTFEEEQGVNILYLAVGMLQWFEADNSDTARYAPLILVPVSLDRGNAAERFKLRWRNEDCSANLCLQAKMKTEFGLIIPDLPENDDLDVSAYMQAVQSTVSAMKRFEVKANDMVLGFFSFAKFVMYRDLDPTNWPENGKLDGHPLIRGLLGDGFPAADGMIGEDENVDKHLSPADMLHVVDADSSQTLVIEEVRRKRNLVIQGPPGTGKSQTITNMIAQAVADGKKVLFVAEKMAALEVVYRRMNKIGLGPLCLELHSHKANKRAVLDELRHTRELSRPRAHHGERATAKLAALRDKLNAYSETLHMTQQPSGLTAFHIIGHSVRLRQDSLEARGIVLEEPERWSVEDRREREELLADVVARIGEIGIPAQHPWRGVARSSMLLPNEYDRLPDKIEELRQLFESVMEDASTVEQRFPSTTQSLTTLHRAAAIAGAVTALPDADDQTLAHALWRSGMPLLNEIVQGGMRHAELKQKLTGIVAETAWNTGLAECRQQLSMHGESFLRFLKSGHRRAVALLKSLITTPMPKAHAERLVLVDDIMAIQRLEKFLKEQQESGASAFGRLWQGVHSDWPGLAALVAWRNNLPLGQLPSDFLTQYSRITSPTQWKEVSKHLQRQVPEFFNKLTALFNFLQLDARAAFGVQQADWIDRQELATRLGYWIEDSEALSKWILFKRRYDDLCAKGVRAVAERLWSGDMPGDKAHGVFERAYFDVLTQVVFTAHPQLREFDGDQHSLLVANFRENDRDRIKQSRIEIRTNHYKYMPRNDGGIGALGVLNGEFAKKRNHLSIRQLVKRAGPAMQAIKPVFMMSPLSVAQFLEPGALQFELLVIDEASQVEPVDALGAIARVKQVVVVGDSRQLPPTRFFSRMTGNISEDNEEEESTVAPHDVESILNLCLARGLPERMLRWHYRSKHQSLIALSNREFYDNRLFIVPSPYDAAPDMGLKFNHLPHALFDSGGTATNPLEAKAVALAVIHHTKEHPDLSLGVGTFSIKQKQAIMDELEAQRRTNPETEHFFMQANRDEPFFIKNLENIQGDERDVIFISVGYGRNQSGYMAMRFGPLSAEGGERRLNVLISRAKRRCEVFSSITADDIDLERGKGVGVVAFKRFLKFAQTGKLDFGRMTDREPDSIFEEQVAGALRARGYDVKTQIGIAGFFIDLAVVDQDLPGRFVLGVECDGAGYHSSRSARDRDRLRQAVLEDHGWIIHRIWSTDWFHRPKEQLEKTISAIEQAKCTLASREHQSTHPAGRPAFEIVSHDGGDTANLHSGVNEKKLGAPYQEAVLPVPSHIAPHEVTDHQMAEVVTKIVEVEGPIHGSEVITRVRMLWNLARAGGRIRAKVKKGLTYAARCGSVIQEAEFYLNQDAEIQVRDRSVVSSPSLRKPECLPPHEIKMAILALVEANYGASHDQLPAEVARVFGFKSTSSQLREIIEPQIQALLTAGKLRETGGNLTLAEG